MNLFLVEFYQKNPKTGECGWDIAFAWVGAADRSAARAAAALLPHFDEVIQVDEQAEVVPLIGDFRCNTPDANLFFVNVSAEHLSGSAQAAPKQPPGWTEGGAK